MDLDKKTERRGSSSFKWDDNEREFGRKDLLPFWVADMDFETPAPILDAIRARCAHPVLGYEIRSDAHYEAVVDWLRRRHDWTVPRDWLMFCPPSSIVGIHGVIARMTDSSASILVHTPAYGPLLALAKEDGRQLIECPLTETDGRFLIDADSLSGHIRPNTEMIILCNPHNPTGRVFTSAELQVVADIATRQDLLVVSDEVHCDLVMPGHRHIPFGKVSSERSVTVISANKTFNTAGIPQATLIIPDAEIRQRFKSYLDIMQLNHESTFGAAGMVAGYRQCGDWLDQVVTYLSLNHEYAENWLADNLPVVSKVRAEATYLAWLDFRRTGLPEVEISRRLVHTGGVGLYPGTNFGEAGNGFFRMNLACPRSQLQLGLERIRSSLSGD